MRISDLSGASGVAVPTVKYYLREGLLPAGEATAVNQARYNEQHLRRLRLIRALTEIGGLSLRSVKAVLDAIDDDRLPLHELLGVAQYALEAPVDEPSPEIDGAVEALLRDLGWRVDPDAPARRTLGRAMATLQELGRDVSPATLARYADAVDALAASEVASVPKGKSRAESVEHVVVGTVLYEAVLDALRRLAQEHHSAERFRNEQP
jgi:DNA-binding transcriptional MerR regulator